jgi:hypothetical protein
MSPEEYKESKRVNLPEFEFDEDFDPDCFEENTIKRDPLSLNT